MDSAKKPEHSGNPRKRFAWVLLALILLLAACLRFYKIDAQSFWDDEVSTIHVASYPVTTIWKEIALMDSSPMMFYTLFRPYLLRVPNTEVALRSFSVLLSLAALIFFFLLANRIAGRSAAFFGTFLLAINPFQIYCSQEVRYNSLVLLACLASFYFFIRLLQGGRFTDLLGYVLATTIGIYTHYFAFFTPLVQVLYVCVLLVQQWRGVRRDKETITRLGLISLLTVSVFVQGLALAILAIYYGLHKKHLKNLALWLTGLLVTAVLFVPFLKQFGYQLLKGVPFREPIPVFQALEKLWVYATVGHSPMRMPGLSGLLEPMQGSGVYDLQLLALLLPLASLAVLGLFGWKKGQMRALALLLFVVPICASLLIMLATRAFDPRYALPYFPALTIFMGKGLATVSKHSRVAVSLAVLYIVAITGASVHDYYHNPAYARQDWRGSVREIVDASREGDAILFYDHYVSLPFLHYFNYERPYYYLFSLRDDLKRSLPERRFHLARNMERFVGEYERFWLFDYHGFVFDPMDEVRGFLRDAGYQRIERDCQYQDLHRWCVDLYTSDQGEVAEKFASMIRFKQDEFVDSQLVSGWQPGKESMRWMGREASVIVKRSSGENEVFAEFYANYSFHGSKPFSMTLSVEGAEVASVLVDREDLYRLQAELSEDMNDLAQVTMTLTSGSTFVPAQVLGGDDQVEKSVLVSRIGVQP